MYDYSATAGTPLCVLAGPQNLLWNKHEKEFERARSWSQAFHGPRPRLASHINALPPVAPRSAVAVISITTRVGLNDFHSLLNWFIVCQETCSRGSPTSNGDVSKQYPLLQYDFESIEGVCRCRSSERHEQQRQRMENTNLVLKGRLFRDRTYIEIGDVFLTSWIQWCEKVKF